MRFLAPRIPPVTRRSRDARPEWTTGACAGFGPEAIGRHGPQGTRLRRGELAARGALQVVGREASSALEGTRAGCRTDRQRRIGSPRGELHQSVARSRRRDTRPRRPRHRKSLNHRHPVSRAAQAGHRPNYNQAARAGAFAQSTSRRPVIDSTILRHPLPD
jgi:hypothetical protein